MQLTNRPATLSARATRSPFTAQRPARLPVCRSTGPESSSPATAETAEKMKSTMSALDALLPTPPPPPPPPARATSSASASTSGSSSPSPAAPTPTWPPAGSSAPASTPAPARKPAGLSFDQVMGFSGLAPEVINGRAAMIGFVMAISNELNNGESLFAQAVSGGAAKAVIVILAVTVASFAPAIRAPLDEVFNKAPKQMKEFGPFTAQAEGLNGRLAMVGLALLLFFEGAGSSAFFM